MRVLARDGGFRIFEGDMIAAQQPFALADDFFQAADVGPVGGDGVPRLIGLSLQDG